MMEFPPWGLSPPPSPGSLPCLGQEQNENENWNLHLGTRIMAAVEEPV